MRRISGNVVEFARHFFRYVAYLRGVIVMLILLLALGGVAVSWLESLGLGESLYFAFITGLTIGYGNISPETPLGRVVSILIGMIGMIFTGVMVAIATKALSDAVREDLDAENKV